MIILKCPECGGNIEYKAGQRVSFCPYCGTHLYFDDENRTYTISSSEKKEYFDRTEIEKMKLKRQFDEEDRKRSEREDRNLTMFLVVCAIIFAFIVVFLGIII